MIKKYPMNWVSSLDPNNEQILKDFACKMGDFYSNSQTYYSNIVSSEINWVDQDYLPLQEIIHHVEEAQNVLEIGCGQSPILKFYPQFASRYTGIDFSEEVISDNKNRFAEATYQKITDPYCYPFENHSFDLIFSVFVIEHTVFPNLFLDECMRLLKPGGKIIILAPSYLKYKVLASQQVSESLKSGRELFQEGKIWEAMRAVVYNKFMIPQKMRNIEKNLPAFYININPLCFLVQEFRSDVDAVYIVSEEEIILYLENNGFKKHQNSVKLDSFVTSRKLCFQIYHHDL